MRSVRVGGRRGGDEGAEKKDECKTINSILIWIPTEDQLVVVLVPIVVVFAVKEPSLHLVAWPTSTHRVALHQPFLPSAASSAAFSAASPPSTPSASAASFSARCSTTTFTSCGRKKWLRSSNSWYSLPLCSWTYLGGEKA